MKRRAFIAGLGGAAAWPLTARAQRSGAPRTVGVLMTVAENDPDSQRRIAAFRQGFADLGWKDGQNVRLEYRWAAGRSDLINKYAEELTALAPDVILANSTPVVAALQKVTKSIPIVFALANDPVGLGFVQSLARPGGNITGFTFINPALIGKWLGLLGELRPVITRAALLFNPDTAPFYRNFLPEIEAARHPGTAALLTMPVVAAAGMEQAISGFAQTPGGALLIGPDPFTIVHIKEIVQLAEKARLPAISVYRQFTAEGGLMAYGPDTTDIFRRSAAYVDRILRGASPAGLPVQEPDKFEFIVNLKAAKTLGLELPPTLLATADEVIE
jgi:putative tryptophan/tyrosine transport system substrate-binding protein